MYLATAQSDPQSSGASPIITILIALAVIGFAVYALVLKPKLQAQEREAMKNAGVLAALSVPGLSLALTKDALIDSSTGSAERHSLVGISGSVEQGGSLNRRFTVTRLALLGPLALGVPKRIDDRALYITIEGPDVVIVRDIDLKKNPNAAVAARSFVARLNQASLPKPEAASQAAVFAPEPTATTGGDLTAKLTELTALRDSGVISDVEFEAKRSQMLDRF